MMPVVMPVQVPGAMLALVCNVKLPADDQDTVTALVEERVMVRTDCGGGVMPGKEKLKRLEP